MSSENRLPRLKVERNGPVARGVRVTDEYLTELWETPRSHAPLGRRPSPARVPDAYWYRLAIVAVLAVAAITLGVVSDRLRTVEPDAWAADAGWIACIVMVAVCLVCFVRWFMAGERA